MLIDSALFIVAAIVVWLAGTRIARYAQQISQRTGLGQAVIGLLLLGGITSLPELGTSITAAARENAPLAVNNLIGGVALQVALLAVADVVYGRDALSSAIAHPNVLLLATLNILLLAVVAAGIGIGEVGFMGVGAWAFAVALFYMIAVWRVSSFRQRESWIVPGAPSRDRDPLEPTSAAQLGNRGLAIRTVVAAVVILLAGYVLATRGEAIAEHTGLGASFVGAIIVALATSLPEISTLVEAVRLRQYAMAFADIFGTNLFDLALIFVVDAVYPGPYVLEEVGRFSLFGALLALALTAVYLAGLVERRDRAILRMGIDSLVVLILYGFGVVMLYTLRAG